MALHQYQIAMTHLLAFLVLASFELSTSHVLKGSVTCLDCSSLSDLSDIKVLVKCSQVKKLVVATTTEDGAFKTELPSDTPASASTPPPPPSPLNCHTKILGGPVQLYASAKHMLSKLTVKPTHDDSADSYTISTPLNFYTSCPVSNKEDAKCRARNAQIGSSKTVNLPLPSEWGLAPSSFYVPFMPIIGIP